MDLSLILMMLELGWTWRSGVEEEESWSGAVAAEGSREEGAEMVEEVEYSD